MADNENPDPLELAQASWDKKKAASPIYMFLLDDAKLVSASSTTVTAQLKLSQVHVNSKGSIHGTVSACLVDWAGGLAIAAAGKENSGVSTDIHVSYLGTAREGETIEIEAKALKIGGTMAYTSIEIRKVGGGAIATGLHTKFIR